MGLINILRRIIKPDANDESDSISFLGDLSEYDTHFSSNSQNSVANTTTKEVFSPDSDSVDSVVYITFQRGQKELWSCSECGTLNSISYDGCVVCGLKKNH